MYLKFCNINGMTDAGITIILKKLPTEHDAFNP